VQDARRHAIENGDEIELATGGDQVDAVAVVRSGVPEGSVFLSPPVGLEGPVEIRSRQAVAS
jgi:anaerobic selenocysteine-containing dehydrogenase